MQRDTDNGNYAIKISMLSRYVGALAGERDLAIYLLNIKVKIYHVGELMTTEIE